MDKEQLEIIDNILAAFTEDGYDMLLDAETILATCDLPKYKQALAKHKEQREKEAAKNAAWLALPKCMLPAVIWSPDFGYRCSMHHPEDGFYRALTCEPGHVCDQRFDK